MTIKTNTSEGTTEYGNISSAPGHRKELRSPKTYENNYTGHNPSQPGTTVRDIFQGVANTIRVWTLAGAYSDEIYPDGSYLGKTWRDQIRKGAIYKLQYTGPVDTGIEGVEWVYGTPLGSATGINIWNSQMAVQLNANREVINYGIDKFFHYNFKKGDIIYPSGYPILTFEVTHVA